MMAVPFALPEDEINNLIATVIFILSEVRLERTEEDQELRECMEELVRLLLKLLQRRLRSSDYDNHLRQTLSLLRQSLDQFAPHRITRRRTSSESSCCDDTKSSLQEVDSEDCRQVGLILRKLSDDDDSVAIVKGGERGEKRKNIVEETTLFSRLVPGVRRTFWTAVPLICMVGWHLFQTSYCM